MIELFYQEQSRREFLKNLGRYSMLGGLVCSAGVLIAKRESASAEVKPIDVSICRSCAVLNRCDRPPALLAKQEMFR